MKRKLQLLVYSLLGFLYMKGLIGPVKWSWGDKPEKYLLQIVYAEIKSKSRDVSGMCSVSNNLYSRGLLTIRDVAVFDLVIGFKKPSYNVKYAHYTKNPLWMGTPYWWEPFNNKPRLEFLKEVIKNEY